MVANDSGADRGEGEVKVKAATWLWDFYTYLLLSESAFREPNLRQLVPRVALRIRL